MARPINDRPNLEQLEKEYEREKYRNRFIRTVENTVAILVIVAAIAVLLSSMLMPVFRIYGTSMNPTLNEGDIVAAIKTTEFNHKDLIAFYYNNRILVKRVIATS